MIFVVVFVSKRKKDKSDGEFITAIKDPGEVFGGQFQSILQLGRVEKIAAYGFEFCNQTLTVLLRSSIKVMTG